MFLVSGGKPAVTSHQCVSHVSQVSIIITITKHFDGCQACNCPILLFPRSHLTNYNRALLQKSLARNWH